MLLPSEKAPSCEHRTSLPNDARHPSPAARQRRYNVPISGLSRRAPQRRAATDAAVRKWRRRCSAYKTLDACPQRSRRRATCIIVHLATCRRIAAGCFHAASRSSQGVPMSLKNPVEMLLQWAKEQPNKPWLYQPANDTWKKYTFAECEAQVRGMATALRKLDRSEEHTSELQSIMR